jgi:VIT1/CCC1 family predicted Fe2+/Mn2+ transporter
MSVEHHSEAPAAGEVPYEEHIGDTRQYMRDIILGVNDGLVSMFLLIAGVVGGGLTSRQILLTGIAGAIAGAISMAAGEYMATKSQEEVFRAEEALELVHLEHHREIEIQELRDMFGDMGIEGDDLERVVQTFNQSDEAMMKVMMALEFGVVDSERRSPFLAAAASGVFFITGSLPSVVPFVFDPAPETGLLWAAILAGVGLFAVGVIKTTLTRTNAVRAGLENLGVALAGAALSFGVGKLFDQVVG